MGCALLALALAAALPACGREAPGDACSERVAPIAEGFGAAGPHRVESTDLAHPRWPERRVSVFLPSDVREPVPTLLLAHAYGEDDPGTYRGLIGHLVSRGHAVVFPPYSVAWERHGDRLEALWSGFAAALAALPERLDPARLGFLGHSYGGGAVPALARRALVDAGWGRQGAFLLLMAPWFAFGIGPDELADFPSHAMLLVMVFEDDTANDHRIAIEHFRRIGVPDANKDYVLVGSDRHGGCALPAVHTVPLSRGLRARDDALDDRALFRLADALAAAAFAGDERGRQVALGHGSDAQVRMGTWSDGTPMRPLVWRADPRPPRPQSFYLFRQDDAEEWLRFGAPEAE